MHFTALTVAAFSAAAAAAGTAGVENNCDFDVYFWAVGDNEASTLGRFSKGKGFSGALEDGTRELKVSTDEDALTLGSSQTSLVYAVNDDIVSYDVYNIFGSPFTSLKVEAGSEDEECESIEWADGQTVAGSQTKTCTSEATVVLTLCG